jgi:hypothetical protein
VEVLVNCGCSTKKITENVDCRKMVPPQKHAQAHTALQVLSKASETCPLITSLSTPEQSLPISSLFPQIKITRKGRSKMTDIMNTT